MSIEYYKSDTTSQWYFRIVARNRRIVAQSEGYLNRLDCLKTARNIRGKNRWIITEALA